MSRLIAVAAALIAAVAAPAWGQRRVPAPEQPAKPDVTVPADTNPDPKSLEFTPATLDQARALARQLGSRDYFVREAASRELSKIGRAAITALKEVRATDSSPEVRLRTDILLPRAESDDMRARVYCFLADKDGKFDHKLPGWDRFKALAGTDKPARELFAEVLKRSDYHTLLMACELPANELTGLLGNHYNVIMQKQQSGTYTQPSAAEVTVMAFLECQHSDKVMSFQSPFWGNLSVANFLYHQEVQNAMRNGSGKYGEPLKRIITKWMDTRETAFGIQNCMNLAQNWGMKDGLKYAARALTADDGGQPWIKAYAAQQIAQRSLQKDGKAEVRKYLPELVKALDSEGVISSVFLGRKNPNEAAVVQMRDYALGLLCAFTDQKPADYGLTPAPNAGNNINNYANWYFADPDKEKADEKRKAGIKKFKEWAEKNLKAEMEKKDEPAKKDPPKKEEPKGDAPIPDKAPARSIIKK